MCPYSTVFLSFYTVVTFSMGLCYCLCIRLCHCLYRTVLLPLYTVVSLSLVLCYCLCIQLCHCFYRTVLLPLYTVVSLSMGLLLPLYTVVSLFLQDCVVAFVYSCVTVSVGLHYCLCIRLCQCLY